MDRSYRGENTSMAIKPYEMDKWTGKVALVTGASAGIGAATAKRLVELGMTVIGCARNTQKIEEFVADLKDSKGTLTAIQCDISKEDQILSMFNNIKQQFGGVDICINNAGLAHNAPLLNGRTEKWRHMYDVNVIGLMICTREAVKSMEARGVDDGAIVLVSSIVGHKVFNNPATHVYASTKFAVRAIAEGLRNELQAKGSHIRVTSISPGLVETEFAPRMTPQNPELGRQFYKRYTPLQGEDIVDAIVYSLSAPVRAQVHDILILPTEGPLSDKAIDTLSHTNGK